MANKPPAFQFYVKDWLSSESVVVMTAEQRGWYIQLLCHAWNGEPIATLPTDDRKLKALAGAGDSWATDKQAVLDCFEVESDRLVNRRLADQFQQFEDFRNSKSDAGRKGNEARWGKNRKGIAQPAHSDDSAIATDRSSSSPSVPKVNVTDTGSKSEDSRVEQGGDQEPNLGETPNPQRDKLTLSELLNHVPAWLDRILSESFEVRRKVICVAEWVDKLSTVWKGKPCLGLGGYRAMEKSYDKFYAKVPAGKKPHELPLNAKAASVPVSTNGGDIDIDNLGGDSAVATDFFLCAKCDCLLPVEQVDFHSKDVPFHKGKCGGRCQYERTPMDGPAAPDKCVCEEPLPDTNGNSEEVYGVSCRRCGKFVKYPEDSTPSKAFEIED